MKALIVYDTKHGMTEQVAKAIMNGMKEGDIAEIVLKKAADVVEEDFKAADAWILGSPVHIGGATGEAKKALKLAIGTATAGKKGTAFDTRFANTKGKAAAEKLAEKMEEAGVKKVIEPQGFVVLKTKGPLAEGEEGKATAFGKQIAAALKA